MGLLRGNSRNRPLSFLGTKKEGNYSTVEAQLSRRKFQETFEIKIAEDFVVVQQCRMEGV